MNKRANSKKKFDDDSPETSDKFEAVRLPNKITKTEKKTFLQSALDGDEINKDIQNLILSPSSFLMSHNQRTVSSPVPGGKI
jgi:hypothetical protein